MKCRVIEPMGHRSLNLNIVNTRTLPVNIRFICTSFINRKESELVYLFRSKCKYILHLS